MLISSQSADILSSLGEEKKARLMHLVAKIASAIAVGGQSYASKFCMRCTNHIVDQKLAKGLHDAAFEGFGGEALFVALAEHEESLQ